MTTTNSLRVRSNRSDVLLARRETRSQELLGLENHGNTPTNRGLRSCCGSTFCSKIPYSWRSRSAIEYDGIRRVTGTPPHSLLCCRPTCFGIFGLESLGISGRLERRGAAGAPATGPRVGPRPHRVACASGDVKVCAGTGRGTIVSTAPRLRDGAFALSCKALTFAAAQAVTASAEPVRSSVARPGRAPEGARRSTRAAVARSTDSNQAAEAGRPGRAPLAVRVSRTPER